MEILQNKLFQRGMILLGIVIVISQFVPILKVLGLVDTGAKYSKESISEGIDYVQADPDVFYVILTPTNGSTSRKVEVKLKPGQERCFSDNELRGHNFTWPRSSKLQLKVTEKLDKGWHTSYQYSTYHYELDSWTGNLDRVTLGPKKYNKDGSVRKGRNGPIHEWKITRTFCLIMKK